MLGHCISDAGDPKSQRLINNNNYFQMKHSTWLGGLTSASTEFGHVEAINHCRKLHFERIDTLVASCEHEGSFRSEKNFNTSRCAEYF